MKMEDNLSNRVICSNVHYFYYDTETFFQSMQKNGLKNVELYLGTPHIFIDGNMIDDFSRVTHISERYGIEILSVHPESLSHRYNLCSLDEFWNEKSLQAHKHCIDYAAENHIAQMNFNIAGGFRDVDEQLLCSRISENIKTLVRYAEEKGVNLVLETESPAYEGTVTTLDFAQRLDQYTGGEILSFGLNLDALEYAGETAEDWERCFPGRIRHIRVSDMDMLKEWKANQVGKDCTYDIIVFPTSESHLEVPFDTDSMVREILYGIDES